MTDGRAHNGRIELAYLTTGPATGEPLLLILGVGPQLVAWHDDFCAALVARGFQPARFDNRDAGLSTHLHEAGRPSRLSLLAGRAGAAPYRLDDLADDAVAVLDALGWRTAHLLGVSYGGMIAQVVATRYPARVRSLTSISSTTSPRIGRPTAGTILRLLSIARRPVATREDAARHFVDLQPLVGSPQYPPDLDWLRELGRRSFDRAHDQAGVERQSAAFQSSGDRRAELATVRVPTLVIHGAADRMIRPAGGRATAAAVPGARLVVYPGMGHDLPRALWPSIIEEIVAISRMDPTAVGRDAS
jgi:pimeloyl-ACP methyl ester carboxylesterase